jgi:hypothetical protein
MAGEEKNAIAKSYLFASDCLLNSLHTPGQAQELDHPSISLRCSATAVGWPCYFASVAFASVL